MYHYKIHIYLSGDVKYCLCTVESPEAVASVVATLCRADRPEFTKLEVELCQPIHRM